MPQEEYRRKRTTADEEVARSVPEIRCIWRAAASPVDSAAAFTGRPPSPERQGAQLPSLEPLALPSDPDCGEAFDVCSIFL